MPEEIKTAAPTAPVTPVDTKTAPVPPVAAPATIVKAEVVDNKAAPAPEVKTEPAAVKPAEELKSLLDEASEEEVKLDKDGKPIVEEAKKVTPDKYTFKLAEGLIIDEAKMKVIEPLFKELGLDNEQAQKLVDAQMQLTKASEDEHVKQWEAYLEAQKTQAKEYFGTKLPEVMRNMARARDTFIPKDANGKSPLLDKFNAAGFSNDKDFIEFMDRVGRVIGEGKFVEGKRSAPGKGMVGVETPTGKQATLADVYPSMAKV